MKTLGELKAFLGESNIGPKLVRFTLEEKRLLISIINELSEGGHPIANLANLGEFKLQYVKDLIQSSIGKLTPDGIALVKEMWKKLHHNKW